jgi:alkylated DNA nucleotide flippase Atl1
MQQQEDLIVDISEHLERFFGYSGKMLKPSITTVETLISKIPRNKLITINQLRKELALQFKVQVTCPSDTKQALKAIANNLSTQIPFWRVIKTNGELIDYFPGGRMGHAALLTQEGFVIDSSGKVPKVVDFKKCLVP